MLGMIEGNGHPYSWSAIVNGYNPEEMAKCPFPVIPQYLAEVPLNTMRIPGARVTHVWTDDPADAPKVAAASRIENVVARPEDVIGQVDAVIIGTDDGHEHVRRARPFIEAGLPMFVDKPLAINVPDLNQFIRWHQAGKVFLSSSNMRYAPEIKQILRQKAQLGELRWITTCTSKTWERYAIHALEGDLAGAGAGLPHGAHGEPVRLGHRLPHAPERRAGESRGHLRRRRQLRRAARVRHQGQPGGELLGSGRTPRTICGMTDAIVWCASQLISPLHSA